MYVKINRQMCKVHNKQCQHQHHLNNMNDVALTFARIGGVSLPCQAAVWFLSDAASYASGANIRVAGGRPMGGAQ